MESGKISKKEKPSNAASSGESMAYRVLIEPWVTEAATAAMEQNKYIFKVSSEAGKPEIKKSVEEMYKVKVISVRTINIPRKLKNYGRTPGWKSGFKKAIVTLKKGDKIELFEGV